MEFSLSRLWTRTSDVLMPCFDSLEDDDLQFELRSNRIILESGTPNASRAVSRISFHVMGRALPPPSHANPRNPHCAARLDRSDLRATAQFHKQDNGAAANLLPNGTTSALS